MSNFETIRSVVNGFRLEVADKVRISDASGWSTRLVYKYLLGYRNKLLFEKLVDKRYPLSQLNYQTIPCVPLDEVPPVECPCQPESTFKFLRSVHPIPNYIGNVRSVLGGLTAYDYVEWDKFKYKLSSRFEAERKKPYWTIRRSKVRGVEGNYLYLYNDQFKEVVTFTAIFTDPLEAFNYPDCEGKINRCFSPLDREFIVDQQLIPIIYDLALNQLAKGKVVVSDIRNDNQDNVSNTQIPPK